MCVSIGMLVYSEDGDSSHAVISEEHSRSLKSEEK